MARMPIVVKVTSAASGYLVNVVSGIVVPLLAQLTRGQLSEKYGMSVVTAIPPWPEKTAGPRNRRHAGHVDAGTVSSCH